MDSKEAAAILREHSDRIAKWVGPKGDEGQFKRYSQALADGADALELLAWLQEQSVDTIYLDDGRIIDVRSGNLIDALRARVRVVEERKDGLNGNT